MALFMQNQGLIENWAMNNNQMKLFDHFYYKYTYPRDTTDPMACDRAQFRCDWFTCDDQPWDGVSNSDCWIERCKNPCGDELCKKWNQSYDYNVK
jgi:hypothetical protein